jgi:uncharacterized protein YndB with AHSA1/START domain
VDLTVSLEAPHPPEAVFACVADLERYPSWLEIVPKVEPGDDDGSWFVYLRGRLGPLARSKRLRMVCAELDAPRHVRFERAETDGREHSAWVLEADVAPAGGGSTLAMRLHYGGGLFGPVVERLLADEIDRSRQRLLDTLAANTP